MRIKLNENLPASLSLLLRKLGHNVSTVEDEGLGGSPDSVIWLAAQREARFLITQDLDFSDLRTLRSGDTSRNSFGSLAFPESASPKRPHHSSLRYRRCRGVARMLRHCELAKNTSDQGIACEQLIGTRVLIPCAFAQLRVLVCTNEAEAILRNGIPRCAGQPRRPSPHGPW
jgi:hypothetical protein